MKKCMFLLICLMAVIPCYAQDSFSLSGKVTDKESGEPLAGAEIYSREYPARRVMSNAGGGFSLMLAPGNHTIVCSRLGYETAESAITMNRDAGLNISLTENPVEIDNIVVRATSYVKRVADVQIGVERIEISEMARVPVLFGERDIMKSIQLLPGVKSDGDGSSGYQVRGGTSAQNLILLDNATVYNSGHLMGIFSAFNDEVIASASLYKGQIPAQFGGATSSVFDIATKDGDMQRYGVNGSIGLLSARLNVEGPMVRDKLSFFAAGRRSYLDMFLNLSEQYRNNVMNFYDVNAKVSYNAGSRDMLFVSFFTGRDNLGLDGLMEMKWSNSSVTGRWSHQFGKRLHSGTSLIYSVYDADNSMEILDVRSSFQGFIRQAVLNETFTWQPNGRHNVNMGIQSAYIWLKSAEWESMGALHQKEQREAWDNAVWINEEWKTNDKLEVSAGLRLNAFSALGGSPYYLLDDGGDILETLRYGRGEIVKTHFTLEPRLSMNYRINEQHSVKAGYSRTSQNIHAVRNSTTSTPFDRYTMSSNIIKPQRADQVSAGYAALVGDGKYELSAETYYKAVNNVIDYRDGKSFSSEIEIERLVLAGKGRAYGVELYARKTTGRLTGWISYTLAWAQNRIDGINDGRWYTAGNDRRHDISVVGMYRLTDRWSLAATWVYNTGQALTAPSAKYEVFDVPIYYYAERNGYRGPSYHRLDLSATYTKRMKNRTSEWSFGVYNAYNRYNPYMIVFEADDASPTGTKAIQYSLFGIVPSVSYSFKF